MNSIGISECSELFRSVNERIVDLTEPAANETELIWLICECPNDDCTTSMRMTRPEYDALIMEPGLYALVPGHEEIEHDEIVGRTERFILFRQRHSPVVH
jgi:hypothetical protein